MALRSLAKPDLPLQGIQSSIGIGNGPFQVYLMMLPSAVFNSALAGGILVGLLNVAGIYFLYRFAREFFGERPALIASLLFAVNSWAIIFSRRMQAQDLLVPFQILFFWNAARWLKRGQSQDLVLMFLWLAILSQVYILGLLHVATAGVILLLGWRKLRIAPLAGSVALWAVLSYRYLLGVIIPYRGAFLNVSGSKPVINLDSFASALLMATHKGFQTIAGQAGSVFDATSGFEGLLVLVEMLLFAAGVALVAFRLINSIRARGAPRQLT